MRIVGFLFLVIAFTSCQKECPVCEDETPKPVCSTELTKGLLAYYPFNGNLNDESGNSLHGSAVNGAYLTTGFLGRPNTAAGFDGFDDYIMVQDNGKLTTDSVTISLFVMAKTVNRRHAIVSRVNFENTTSLAWGLGQSLDGINKWEFAVGNAADACSKAHIYDPSIYCTSTQSLVAGQWYHLITSFVDGVQKIYVDGTLKATINRNFKTLKKCTTAQFIIGGWWKGDITSIDGKVDEVRVYNRGLSECEIKELSKTFN
ncbi:LamG domain-containing protein [Flavitalea antarctica]